MGVYRASDLVTVPGLLSLARVPLGLLFLIVADQPALAMLVIASAAISDVLDGWYARRFGMVTATGAAIDPLTDKFFVAAMVVALLLHQSLPWWAAPALAAREIGELPLVLWVLASRRARRVRVEHPQSNVPGKLATCMQFATVASAIVRAPWTEPLIGATAAVGALAAVIYWRRELERWRKADGR